MGDFSFILEHSWICFKKSIRNIGYSIALNKALQKFYLAYLAIFSVPAC